MRFPTIIIFYFIFFISITNAFCQSVGIGTSSPDSSAILELKSNTKGLLVPRMTQDERMAIPNPAAGLLIFQINADTGFYFYSGSRWKKSGAATDDQATILSLLAPKKKTLVLFIWGQSNSGTDPDFGKVEAAQTPAFYTDAFQNVLVLDPALTGGTNPTFFQPYEPGVNATGYIPQIIYTCAKEWETVFVIKRGVGGTKLAVRTGQGAYPRADFSNRYTGGLSLISKMLDTTTCDFACIGDQVESDALLEEDAHNYGKNEADWFRYMKDTLGIPYHQFVKFISDRAKDFPYRSTVRSKQDSNAIAWSSYTTFISADSILHKGDFTGNGDADANDYSHYNLAGCQELARRFTEAIFSYFKRTKKDNIKPVITGAYTDTTGKLLTLKFSERLSTATLPPLKHFVCATKVFSNAVVNGSTIELTPTVPFYTGASYKFRYAKDSIFKAGIQDLQCNNVDAIPSYTIKNLSTVAAPVLTTNYASNFSTGTDGWTAASGCTITGAETSPGGRANSLKAVCTNVALVSISRGVTPSFTAGKSYRVEFDVEMPDNYRYPSLNGFYFQFKVPANSSKIDCKNFLNRDKMCHVEFEFTMASTSGTFYIQTVGLVGDAFWLSNFKVAEIL